mgnify:CR=1 FL=1
MSNQLIFKTRTTTITIDYSKCIAPKCGFACVKACRLYGRSILKIENGLPKLILSPEEVVRRDNECLACEINCMWYGGGAIKIDIPL